ncbi:hypothetical protein Syun_009364 [Stephania yunnanensis]|uniref:Uncharacterized protein n=1 Tax=Stephania yunnanensis TaxID=152371 RepID=A0AAP0KFF0_9MAGN
MTIMFCLWKSFRQLIRNVVFSRYSANLYVSPLNNFYDEMKMTEYMFGSVV